LATDGNQAVGKAAFRHGHGGAALALIAEIVHVLAVEPLLHGDDIGAQPHIAHGVHFPQVEVAAVDVAGIAQGRGVGGHFHATGDDQVFKPGNDAGGRHVHGGDAGPAKAVHGGAAGGGVVAGIQGGHAGDAVALLAHLGDTADDDVVNLRGIELVALGNGGQHLAEQALGVNAAVGALSGLADSAGGAQGGGDPGFVHSSILWGGGNR